MLKTAFSLFSRLLLTVCILLMLVSFTDLVCPSGESEIYDSIIRLHILANSDSDADQSLKLDVRDAIISECENMGGDGVCDTDTLALKMTETANRVLNDNGVGYTAHAVYGYEAYPTREYDGIAFPAGRYRSLRIVLGSGEGHNWWCVLFPPLCLSAATAEQGMSAVGINGNSYKVYTQRRYVIRFRLLEWFN